MAITTGMLLFEDMEELDFVGPWEVFTMARMNGHEDDRVVTRVPQEGPFRHVLFEVAEVGLSLGHHAL